MYFFFNFVLIHAGTKKLMLEELTKNIFQLNAEERVDLPGCSITGE